MTITFRPSSKASPLLLAISEISLNLCEGIVLTDGVSQEWQYILIHSCIRKVQLGIAMLSESFSQWLPISIHHHLISAGLPLHTSSLPDLVWYTQRPSP